MPTLRFIISTVFSRSLAKDKKPAKTFGSGWSTLFYCSTKMTEKWICPPFLLYTFMTHFSEFRDPTKWCESMQTSNSTV